MGIAFLMKQQGVFLMVFGGVLLLWLGLRLATYPRKRLLLALPLYSVAAVLPYGLICLWLWRAGVWEKFWFWTVEYASKYVAVVPLSLAGAYLWQSGSRIVEANWPLLLLALGGIAGTALDPDRCGGRGKPGLRSFMFGFLVFSFLCTCPGYYFREHYFIAMLPAVAMLAGVGCRSLLDLAGRLWLGIARAAATPGNHAPAPAARQKRGRSKPVTPEPQPAAPVQFDPFRNVGGLVVAGGGGRELMDKE